MTIKESFCSVPWFEVHINADGTYHTCGAQPNYVSNTPIGERYNVHNTTIGQWVNSKFQRQTRLDKLKGVLDPYCSLCYREESLGSSSKRIRENLRSKIDSEDFENTFTISPHNKFFEHSQNTGGSTDIRPTSYHISLGNECNLACRMCNPFFSSKIASQQNKLGLYTGPLKMNWTDNQRAWDDVVDYMCTTDNLQFVHAIGGETLLNPKFEDLVDRLIQAGKTDIYLGFTTNGSVFRQPLIEKLKTFRHVDIGISVECMGPLNDLIRQGSNLEHVLSNTESFLKFRSESHVYVTMRPVPSALSVHTLDELYQWCVDRQLDVMTNILVRPPYLQIQNLPQHIKDRLIEKYSGWNFTDPLPGVSNPRDPNRFKEHIDNEINAVIRALKMPNDPLLTEHLYRTLETWGWFNNPEIKKYFY